MASYGGGTLVIDEPQRLVTVRGRTVSLTPTEWGVLVALATVPGRVYSRFELINRVRGYEFEGYERTVNSHVKNLRCRIESDPGQPQIVQTVLGGGYGWAWPAMTDQASPRDRRRNRGLRRHARPAARPGDPGGRAGRDKPVRGFLWITQPCG